MNIVFRADASIEIGNGHVMRCLTLADALVQQGASCFFVCRLHPGNMIEFIQGKGFQVYCLEAPGTKWPEAESKDKFSYSEWLGASASDDASQTVEAFRALNSETKPDWLIVDHYGIDENWESFARPYIHNIMVIDDLANRSHNCDLLLDQTFGREALDYQPLVPASCTLLIGSEFALLRPEFARLRKYSLKRRITPKFKKLLITMGGVDKENVTGQVLDALKDCPLPENCFITVVMGSNAPWLEDVRQRVEGLPWPVEVKVNVVDMARLMADSDFCIGAAGSTSWERCCLGLPALNLILAENQRKTAAQLEKAGASMALDDMDNLQTGLSEIIRSINDNLVILSHLSLAAGAVVDGRGTGAVISKIQSITKTVN